MDVPLDPRLHSELVIRAKKQIRARMRALRGGYSSASLAARSARIVERLLESKELEGARSVASFWPMEGRGEVDLRELDAALRKKNVGVYYPFMDPREGGGFATGFRRTASADELIERGNRFREPPPTTAAAQPGEVDVVLVPALAVDARGHRIGYGAGYYDATLPDVCPPASAVMIAYQFQVLAELPAESHDVACDSIITDEQSYSIARRIS